MNLKRYVTEMGVDVHRFHSVIIIGIIIAFVILLW